MKTLNLNDYALTLGSSTSDLTVQNTITIDAITEGISTGGADLTLLASLNISNGSVTSTGGIISLHCSDICKDLGGGQLSGSGILNFSDSTWVLAGHFEKKSIVGSQLSGTLTIPNTDLALGGNSTLTSDVALIFVALNLNDYALTLGSATSGLTIQKTNTIESRTEGI